MNKNIVNCSRQELVQLAGIDPCKATYEQIKIRAAAIEEIEARKRYEEGTDVTVRIKDLDGSDIDVSYHDIVQMKMRNMQNDNYGSMDYQRRSKILVERYAAAKAEADRLFQSIDSPSGVRDMSVHRNTAESANQYSREYTGPDKE